jgi:hypothetical protein
MDRPGIEPESKACKALVIAVILSAHKIVIKLPLSSWF